VHQLIMRVAAEEVLTLLLVVRLLVQAVLGVVVQAEKMRLEPLVQQIRVVAVAVRVVILQMQVAMAAQALLSSLTSAHNVAQAVR
jgi:hypothetical protein